MYLVIWFLLYFVKDLVSHNIEIVLNWKTNMEAVIKIIEENIPEVMYRGWILYFLLVK